MSLELVLSDPSLAEFPTSFAMARAVCSFRALEEKLRLLLSNPELASRVRWKRRAMADHEFTEERWVEHVNSMVEATVWGNG